MSTFDDRPVYNPTVRELIAGCGDDWQEEHVEYADADVVRGWAEELGVPIPPAGPLGYDREALRRAVADEIRARRLDVGFGDEAGIADDPALGGVVGTHQPVGVGPGELIVGPVIEHGAEGPLASSVMVGTHHDRAVYGHTSSAEGELYAVPYLRTDKAAEVAKGLDDLADLAESGYQPPPENKYSRAVGKLRREAANETIDPKDKVGIGYDDETLPITYRELETMLAKSDPHAAERGKAERTVIAQEAKGEAAGEDGAVWLKLGTSGGHPVIRMSATEGSEYPWGSKLWEPNAAAFTPGQARQAADSVRRAVRAAKVLNPEEPIPPHPYADVQDPDLRRALVADAEAEDKGLHGDDRQTCAGCKTWNTEGHYHSEQHLAMLGPDAWIVQRSDDMVARAVQVLETTDDPAHAEYVLQGMSRKQLDAVADGIGNPAVSKLAKNKDDLTKRLIRATVGVRRQSDAIRDGVRRSDEENMARLMGDAQERTRRIESQQRERDAEEARRHPGGPAGWAREHGLPPVVVDSLPRSAADEATVHPVQEAALAAHEALFSAIPNSVRAMVDHFGGLQYLYRYTANSVRRWADMLIEQYPLEAVVNDLSVRLAHELDCASTSAQQAGLAYASDPANAADLKRNFVPRPNEAWNNVPDGPVTGDDMLTLRSAWLAAVYEVFEYQPTDPTDLRAFLRGLYPWFLTLGSHVEQQWDSSGPRFPGAGPEIGRYWATLALTYIGMADASADLAGGYEQSAAHELGRFDNQTATTHLTNTGRS